MHTADRLADRWTGVLLGTAVGDALGLPAEGMSPGAIARRFGRLDRYRLFGATGFVSDDTEQSALVAACLAAHADDLAGGVRTFRKALLGWFCRLPWGLGLGTLRACVRIAFGFRASGVRSAGNGAAMRAAIIGAYWWDDPPQRRAWTDAIARVTHVDPRAVEAAGFVAEVAAVCVSERSCDRRPAVIAALAHVDEPTLRAALALAVELSDDSATSERAASLLGTSGFVVESVPFAAFCWLRFGGQPMLALTETVCAGGDADTNAAIVGAWLGAQHGAAALPPSLVGHLQRGPFGQQHLRDLAADLMAARAGARSRRARYWWPAALIRNLLLFPVVLAHAVRIVASGRARPRARVTARAPPAGARPRATARRTG